MCAMTLKTLRNNSIISLEQSTRQLNKNSEGKRIPYKNKPSIKGKWSEDGSTSISPADNQHLADTENFSALDHISIGKDNTNISNTQGKSEELGKEQSCAFPNFIINMLWSSSPL